MKAIRSMCCLILAFVLCVLTLAGCAGNEKDEIFRLVRNNREMLLEDIAEQDFADSRGIDGIEGVSAVEQYVIYDCGGHGIAPSSTEYGFYYSPEDCPLGVFESTVFSTGEGLSQDGAGYSGHFDFNRYYTEKICDGFWYCEFHF